MSFLRRVTMDSIMVLEQQRGVIAELEQRRRNSPSNQPLRRNSNYLFSNIDEHFILTNPFSQASNAIATHQFRNLDSHYILNGHNSNHFSQRTTTLQLPQQQQHRYNFRKIRIEGGCESETTTCSICLVDFSVGVEAIRLPNPCGHMYHEGCIMKWLQRSSTCPLCRRTVA